MTFPFQNLKGILFISCLMYGCYILGCYFFYLNSGIENRAKTKNFAQPQDLPFEEKILKAGLTVAEHKITTEDGYILTAFRIKLPRSNSTINSVGKKQPVILSHGFLDSSITFMALPSEDCLPFILAKKNFDVWLTNNRGNMFSFEHTNPEKFNSREIGSKYWEFSIDEMAKYDIKANIKYIKKVTNFSKIDYIGHSQGIVQFFYGYTLDPLFFENSIRNIVGFGVAIGTKHHDSPFFRILKKSKLANAIYYANIGNFMNFRASIRFYFGTFCKYALWFCKVLVAEIIGNGHNGKIDYDMIKDILYYQPGGSSSKNLLQCLQNSNQIKPTMFDYNNSEKNIKAYGSTVPPEYKLELLKDSKINFLMTNSTGDPFIQQMDIDLLSSMLPKDFQTFIKLDSYNHIDYLWSQSAATDIYTHVVKFLLK